jgi:uncharacterized integral membrane protein (TIGR02327 family)
MINPNVFLVLRIVLFFVATPFVYKALQSLDLSRIFKANSTDQIRIVLMVLSIILGYFFVDVLMSLFEHVNDLF